MMFVGMHELEAEINQQKEELIEIAEKTGLNSNATIHCSQKLDKLITIYQKHVQPYIKNIELFPK
ncbi:aspartyl-phosphate phosphatase Spo0E family protein [bacterium LRH843]|nr:aspartyl-phosphate phosphatase Spo0E family protein [bacterium LRH843]